MKELMDKKKLLEVMEDSSFLEVGGVPYISRVSIRNLIIDCTLSPDELAEENLKALAVLEKIKTRLKLFPPKQTIEGLLILKNIEALESQAPVSELEKPFLHQDEQTKQEELKAKAQCRGCLRTLWEELKQAKENERKAEAWDKLYLLMISSSMHLPSDSLINYEKRFKDKMDELLAQSEIPPKAEEEKR